MSRKIILVAVVGLLLLPLTLQAQTGTDAAKKKTAPGEPCCSVVAVDARTGVVTYAFRATDARFTFRVPVSGLRNWQVGQTLDVGTSDGVQCQSNAATSGASTRCGSNVDRNADTRPKDCIATNSAGQSFPVPCPRR